jgi:hypothetical protein
MQDKDKFVLRDSNDEIVNIGDIIASKNEKLGKVIRYIYTQDNRGLWLYKLYNDGKYYEDDLGNIRVDSGVRLVNDEDWYWSKEKE